jgi:PAS domain S-box-containing protein
MTRRPILVLEDEATAADHIQATLQRSGYASALVSSEQEALEQAAAIQPALMLVDPSCATPEHLLQALDEIRAHLHIPLIFLMPYGDDAALECAVERAKSTRPDGFVLKPHYEEELVETVEHVLREHEAAHKRAQARTHLLSIAETTPDFVATADVQGRILYLNPAARRLLGIDEGEYLADLHLSDIHPTWANVIVLGEGVETAILDGVWHGETALRTRDGSEVPVSQVILANVGQDGNCEFLSVIARDISDLKRTENALRQSEQMYRRIVESANVGMWIVDPENCIRFANPKIARLLGTRVDAMVGTPLANYLDLAPFASSNLDTSAKEQHVVALRHRSGTEITATLSASPMFDDDERYSGVLLTVTEHDTSDRAH